MKLTKLIIISLISSLLCLSAAHAAVNKKTQRFPRGCRSLGWVNHHEDLVLEPVRSKYQKPETPIQTLYLVHNLTHEKIVVQKERRGRFSLEPAYKNTIRADQWASLALSMPKFQLYCATLDGTRVACADALDICQYNNAKFSHHNGGTHWIIKSTSRKQAVRGSIRSGILLRS